MPDLTSIGAFAISSVSLLIAGRREILSNRRRLHVERGWHLMHDAQGALFDGWVYVMVWNTGGRPLTVEHAGFQWYERGDRSLAEDQGIELADDADVWVAKRAEISLLGDEPIEVAPDGPTRKLLTPLGPLLALGLDAFDQPVEPYVVTAAERYWWGRPLPLMPPNPSGGREKMEAGLDRLREQSNTPSDLGNMYALRRERFEAADD